ncbi:MAG: hypothetical protein ACI4JN_09300 [Ruminococcus sp.]
MDIDKEMKKMEEEVKAEKDKKSAKKAASAAAVPKKQSNPLLEFIIGFLLTGGGIYWVLNSFVVSFSWGSMWSGFGISAPLATGLMLIPLLVGIGLAFFMEKKTFPGIVIALGILIILVTLLTSVRFRPLSASLWQYVVMFGMIAAGAGLLAKSLFKKSE